MELSPIQPLVNGGLIILTAAILAVIGQRFRVPSILTYLLAGILLGPLLAWVKIDASLALISELGIALLLFLVGIELSFAKIKDLSRVAILLGSLQIPLTAASGFILASLVGFDWLDAIFLGATVTFSSTVVVMKLLDEKGATNRLYARVAIALFLAQDIVIILALTAMSGIDASSEISWFSILTDLAFAFTGMALLLGFVLIAARYGLPKPFTWAARSSDTVFIWALSWCFIVVFLAHKFNLSVEIGAFLAGIAIAQLPVHEDLHRRLHPLMTLFIAIFLVTLGIKTEITQLVHLWPQVLLFTVFVLVIKPLIIFAILMYQKFNQETAFHAAIAGGQVSEFAFILLALASSAHLIDSQTLALGSFVGIASIAGSAYLIIYSEKIYQWLDQRGCFRAIPEHAASEFAESQPLEQHVIVIGMNALGRKLVHALEQRGESVVAIDTDPNKLKGLGDAETLIGQVEYPSVLEQVAYRQAKLVVSALQIEETNQLVAYRCRSVNIPCAIHAFDHLQIEQLQQLDVDYLITPAIDAVAIQRTLFTKSTS
jgi:Kef-type K+ transport system membrane component KefB